MKAPNRTPTSLVLASPREPSGGSWLVNCLLELGVRVNCKPVVDRFWRSTARPCAPSAMWQPAPDGRWRLHPRAEALTKWLPILGRRETLEFRGDIEGLYVQDPPCATFTGAHTVLFVRDPRDAVHSSFRRIRPDMPLADFVRVPHHETLLDAIAHWRLFVTCWLARDGVHVYRFEDYKADAEGLLTRIVRDVGLEVSPAAIARAAAASSFEKAREAEQQYRATHPGDEEVANRAGRVGEWKDTPAARDLVREIERRAGTVLICLGYARQGPVDPDVEREGISHRRFLHAFEHLELPPDMRVPTIDPMTCSLMADTLQFASTVNADLLRRARLHAREARVLLDSLQEYAAAWHHHQRQRSTDARAAFADGADYHLSRIRELRAGRRRDGTSTGASATP